MRGDIDVLYRVAKDLAFRYLKAHIYPSSIKLALYKGCLDMHVTKKTIWNVTPLLTDDGVLAIYCSYNNLSHVTEFLREEDMPHDVLLFHGEHVAAQDFATRTAAAIPFVLVYKTRSLVEKRLPNLVEVKSERVMDEIAHFFLSSVSVQDLSLYIGDAASMAYPAKLMGRNVIVFCNDDMFVSVLLNEGVSENEVDPWETIRN
jgi:hypothetical protein